MPLEEYTVRISRELVEQHTDWTRIDSLKVDWFKVVPNEDGTAEVLLSIGEEPPA